MTHEPERISADAPLRLALAAKIAFPDGSMTASGLRREVAKGRLTIDRVASKDYTCLREIEKMRTQCRIQPRAPDCGSGQPEGKKKPSGSSETGSDKSALAAALMTAKRLSKSSAPISPANTARPASAAVIPLPSRSQTS
jgi:hypothetical protein